jgi:hypothetical protein
MPGWRNQTAVSERRLSDVTLCFGVEGAVRWSYTGVRKTPVGHLFFAIPIDALELKF